MLGPVDRHLAFVSMSAHGHVNPTLPVVSELVRRGWRVSYATGDRFAAEVEKAGATLVPTQARPPGAPGPGRLTPSAIAGFLARITDDARTNLPHLQQHFRHDPPRAVCYDAMSVAGRVLAATTGAADVALLPTFATNERSSPFARATAGPPPPEILAAVRDMGELLAAHGLDPQPGPGMLTPASLNVVFLPREFQPGADTFDARFRFVGPAPAAREDGAGWSPPDEPVLFVSLGTAFNDRPEFYRACFEAFGGGGPVAMAVGERVQIDDLGAVPGNVDVRPWFPQPAVLRHARAFVSHAGMGSTMEALYYGVPLVCVPQMLEQEANAARVAELGLGVRLDPDGLAAADLRAAVDTVTADPAIRVALDRMRAAIRRAGGAVAAADAIETHLVSGAPPR
jgi:MGT family glycosyltransferase